MSFAADPREWAESVFGSCDLGDVRRTDRLVDYAARQVLTPAGSTNEVCRGDDAAAEGAYRLLENDAVSAEGIEDAVFDHTADEGASRELLLSIQDTTTLRFDRRAREDLGDIGDQAATNVRGYNVHSSAEPLAAVAGQGCFTVRGTGLATATRARIGGAEARIETLGSDADLRVCPAAQTPLGGQTLEVGDGSQLAALPSQVSVVGTLTSWGLMTAVARGETVVINGSGFDIANPSNNIVTFQGNERATVSVADTDRLAFTVPPAAESGEVTLRLELVDPPSPVITIGSPLVVQPFSITEVDPDQAFAGQEVRVTLSAAVQELSAAQNGYAVTVNEVSAEATTDPSAPDVLVVRLPDSAATGEVSLCVFGDLGQGCIGSGQVLLTVLGPDHTDLLRPPFLEVERLVVVSPDRVGFVVRSTGTPPSSKVGVIDLRESGDPLLVDLGGPLLDLAPIDRPLAGDDAAVWPTHIASVGNAFGPSLTQWVLLSVDVRAATYAEEALPLVSDAEVLPIPGLAALSLRMAHGMRLDTATELVLDDDGLPVSSFGVVGNGAPMRLESAPGALQGVTVRVNQNVLELTPYTGWQSSNLHSDLLATETIDLEPATGCASLGTRELFAGARVVAAVCNEAPDCPAADPKIGSPPSASDKRIVLWAPDLTSLTSVPAIATDLCGSDAAVVAVLRQPASDDLVILWTINDEDSLETSAGKTFASIVTLAGGYQNLSAERLGHPSRIEWPIDLERRATALAGSTWDPLFERYLVALNYSDEGSAHIVAPSSLSVYTPMTLTGPISALAGSPDGRRFYLLHEEQVALFENMQPPRLLGTTAFPSPGRTLAISESGSTLIVTTDNGFCTLGD